MSAGRWMNQRIQAELDALTKDGILEADQAARTAERIHQDTAARLDPITHFEAEPVAPTETETTLEIHSLAARIEVEEKHKGAVGLVLGRRLTLPLLDEELCCLLIEW